MKYSIIFTALSALAVSYAMPTMHNGYSDTELMNFALTLEHLENAFYTTFLDKFTEVDFANAGFEPYVLNRFKQIAEHERTHVAFLEGAIKESKGMPVKPCEYQFPCEDVMCFVALSEILESTGGSAYTGVLSLITDKNILSVAGTIMGTEVRHASWINQGPIHRNPWNTAFEIPLTPNQAFTLAHPLIKSCPKADGTLPFTPFPVLSVPQSKRPGDVIQLTFKASPRSKQLWAAFVTGDKIVFEVIHANNMVQIPNGLMGVVYVFVTYDNTNVGDKNIFAGPAMMIFDFNSSGVLDPPK